MLHRLRSPVIISSTFRTMSTASTSKAARFVVPVSASDLPRGFLVSSTYAGIKAAISPKPISSGETIKTLAKPDLSLIVSTTPASAAGTFTRNAFKAAPVVLSNQVLVDGAKSVGGAKIRSVLVNSGCANAVTGERGLQDAKDCVSLVQERLSPHPGLLEKTNKNNNDNNNNVLLLSTGVIGVPLPMNSIKKCIPHLTSGQVLTASPDAWLESARAFMTTDTFPKLRARSFELAGRKCSIVGIDKGAGMIHPNMVSPSTPSSSSSGLHATMLGLLATDAPISPTSLQSALDYAVSRSFNCISVDGDMSTNDTVLLLANGQALPISTSSSSSTLPHGEEIQESKHPKEYHDFRTILTEFCTDLAHLIVRDGEGSTKFVEIQVKNAPTYKDAHTIASSISKSALFKCAIHGQDANWGRILCAIGYSYPLSSNNVILSEKIDVMFVSTSKKEEKIMVLENGQPIQFSEFKINQLLQQEDISIEIDLKNGDQNASYWTCDFSKEYIEINADYRS